MKRIAITGGPCSGKDTALNSGIVSGWVKEWGFSPHVMPEIATLIIGSGFSPPELLKRNRDAYIAMERLMMLTHFNYVSGIENLAKEIEDEDKILTFENRGLIDMKSYMWLAEFIKIIRQEFGMSEIECRDGRYLAPFHFRTVADVKPDLYMKLYRDNPTRYEDTPEKAVVADERVLQAWLGHPHLRIIPNITLEGRILSFEEKLEIFKRELKHAIGVGGSYEIERKFLIHDVIGPDTFKVPYAKVEIEQVYLGRNASDGRIRKRTQDGYSLFYMTKKKNTRTPDIRIELERQISQDEYLKHLRWDTNPKCRPICKDRLYFVYKNQYFELDIFRDLKGHPNLVILEREMSHKNEKWEIPPWLGRYTDVTDNPEFSNRNLARKK